MTGGASQAAASRAVPPQEGPARPALLLVEDSDTQALRIRRMLESHGFAVTRVASGEAALDSLDGRIPDLVVADYHLPGMNGGQMARQLRMSAVTRMIPVLMLTEGGEPGLEREGLESGADAYVPKSADPDLIVFRIRALLREGAGALLRDGAGARDGMFRRARILIVGGDGTRDRDVTSLAALMRSDGHEVTVAHQPMSMDRQDWFEAAREPDCVVVDLVSDAFDGIAFCRELDDVRQEVVVAGGVPPRILGLSGGQALRGVFSARAFEAGVDDLVADDVEPDVLALRIRALVRRKLLQDEARRVDQERQAREIAVETARAEAASIASKASLAEALEQANAELADANRKLIETQGKLIQTAKMASLGELVAGIAHEINNPLAFILAHKDTVARLLARVIADEERDAAPADAGHHAALMKCRDRVESMNLGLRRIQNLVLNLRKFSRLEEGQFQVIDVPEALETVLALLGQKFGSEIVVERDYRAPDRLYCQSALLNQVLMNIISNAADAIQSMSDAGPARGMIRIGTELRDGEAGRTYVFTVMDNGPGIPPDLKERIFEPFFTTKPVGAGTGLGLAIAYGVVQAHRGTISITDAPRSADGAAAGGTVFTVSVPWQPHLAAMADSTALPAGEHA
ncbi:response regulator receiver sensor signal transduction histidine kinase [Gluconacetobacter diazotrophicus PA1 5]|uniref:histidine kinase n=1 Tax=Gluconacetobacter diazotrophicus TaxID=33996 RepID=A0A7W4FCW0_GLUDI|nr:response regulator [Gluconacetobacter diazotrophicus]ACI52810.1 response regulator receiver sensor signal transduction histidine kinase [Gluconacetobacter diazotrophicus PA1 5]MBB2155451.1 response regulator [Gluconacetobacter diazotrophicus]TWB09045.1 two-component system NtrC family sensor kinase [Gluconacetobacter diazotrophicus]